MSFTFQNPFAYFNNPANSNPVGLGNLYIGLPDTDPVTPANQVPVFAVQTDGSELQIPQPVRMTAGGVVTYGGTPIQLKLDSDVYSVKVTSSTGVQLFYTARSYRPDTDLRGALAAINSSVPIGGVEAGVIANKSKKIILVEDYLNISASHTEAFELAITQAKANNAIQIVLPNQRLNLICNEAGGALSFAAAVVIDGLQDCEIVSGGEDSELFAATGGVGAEAFALFRIQNCNNLKFKYFKVDGDYDNHAGNAGSRSMFAWLTTFDRSSPLVDLQEMRGIHFESIECNDIGGFVGTARRGAGAAYAPNIYDVTIKHCHGVDAARVDNTIGLNFVKGGEISYNKFKNTPIQFPPDVLFVDCSRGCENIEVKHNVGEFYVFGMKAEGSAAGEVYAPSRNINFISNTMLECGDPNSLEAGSGSAAGATYAYKIRSENSLVKNNKWTARTQLVTGGGLSVGILVALGDIAEGAVTVDDGNNGTGSEFGIIQNRLVANGLTKTIIKNNQIRAKQVGILAQVDCDVDDNDVFDTASYAVDLQIANNSRARRNKAFNCGATGGSVYHQGDGGSSTAAGYFEFIDNEIHDSRGASAATNGYKLQAGEVYTNQYRIKPGTTIGLIGNVYFGDYIGLFDRDSVKYSGGIIPDGTVVNGYNISNVTAVDGSTFQINFKRPIPPDSSAAPTTQSLVGGSFLLLFGNTETYQRIRFVNSSGVATDTPTAFNIKSL